MPKLKNPLIDSLPPWMAVAAHELGVSEIAGPKSAREILEYLKCTNLTNALASTDATAWCSAFVCWVLRHSKHSDTNSAAAISYETYGEPWTPQYGAVVVLNRVDPENPDARHVGFYHRGLSSKTFSLLSGNSNNLVRLSTYPLDEITAVRKPIALVSVPRA